jgi:membrane associated rhomboid family serine protease
MMLLPVSHADAVVRRTPWVSIAILGICVAVQVRSCVVEPPLEARAAEIEQEMAQLEDQAIEEHFAHVAADPTRKQEDDVAERIERARSDRDLTHVLAEPAVDAASMFRAGKLTEPGDPRFVRFEVLRAEHTALERQMPMMRLGYRPALDGIVRMLSSMFTHGGWLHLLGNMWFLYLVGCNLEDRWGRWQFLTFYVVAGCIAALTFTALHRHMLQPLVGASGAVAGAMGAFMVCFSRTEITIFYAYMITLVPRWGTFRASAWIVMALWVAEEFVMTLIETSASGTSVAHSAHAGGFLFGAAVAFLLRLSGVDSQLDEASERAADESTGAWKEHPLYIDALQLRDRGADAEAIEKLIQLFTEQPDHVEGRETLLTLGLRSRNLRAIDRSLPFITEHFQRTRSDKPLVALYRELRRVLPDYGLTDQELLRIATAASHVDDGPLVIEAVSELMTQHPESALQPRAMWLAAQAQALHGAVSLQQDTLQRIVRRFPDHACGALAREQLDNLEVTG